MRKPKSITYRLFALTLTLCFALAMLPLSAAAKSGTYSDTSGHWAEDAIERWSSCGVLAGNNDLFRPNDPITRAEMAAVLDRIMKYQSTDGPVFTDVSPSAWYCENVRHLAAAGVVTGVGNHQFAPERGITREEAAVMIGRAFQVLENSGNENPFPDAAGISGWASFLVDGMRAAGYIGGYPDGNFYPKNTVARAEVVTVIDNMVDGFYYTSGEYDNAEKSFSPQSVVVNSSGVTLKNTVIAGNLFITPGVGSGEVSLDNVTVTGTTYIWGGGPNSIIANECVFNVVRLDALTDPAFKLSPNTKVKQIFVGSDATVIQGGVTVAYDTATRTVTFGGTIDKVTLNADGTATVTVGGTVYEVIPPDGAVTTFTLAAGSVVKQIVTNGPVNITGTGGIGKMEVHADGVVIGKGVDVKPENITVDKGIKISVGDKAYSGDGGPLPADMPPAPPSTGGGGGGGGAANLPPIDIDMPFSVVIAFDNDGRPYGYGTPGFTYPNFHFSVTEMTDNTFSVVKTGGYSDTTIVTGNDVSDLTGGFTILGLTAGTHYFVIRETNVTSKGSASGNCWIRSTREYRAAIHVFPNGNSLDYSITGSSNPAGVGSPSVFTNTYEQSSYSTYIDIYLDISGHYLGNNENFRFLFEEYDDSDYAVPLGSFTDSSVNRGGQGYVYYQQNDYLNLYWPIEYYTPGDHYYKITEYETANWKKSDLFAAPRYAHVKVIQNADNTLNIVIADETGDSASGVMSSFAYYPTNEYLLTDVNMPFWTMINGGVLGFSQTFNFQIHQADGNDLSRNIAGGVGDAGGLVSTTEITSSAVRMSIPGDSTSETFVYKETYFWFVPAITGTWRIETKDRSSDCDPYLWLYDGNGNLITSDDDSGGSRNALINRSLQAGQRYVVRAGFYGGGASGDCYSLAITRPATGAVVSVEPWLPIFEGSFTVRGLNPGTYYFRVSESNGNLSSIDWGQDGRGYLAARVAVAANLSYTVSWYDSTRSVWVPWTPAAGRVNDNTYENTYKRAQVPVEVDKTVVLDLGGIIYASGDAPNTRFYFDVYDITGYQTNPSYLLASSGGTLAGTAMVNWTQSNGYGVRLTSGSTTLQLKEGVSYFRIQERNPGAGWDWNASTVTMPKIMRVTVANAGTGMESAVTEWWNGAGSITDSSNWYSTGDCRQGGHDYNHFTNTYFVPAPEPATASVSLDYDVELIDAPATSNDLFVFDLYRLKASAGGNYGSTDSKDWEYISSQNRSSGSYSFTRNYCQTDPASDHGATEYYRITERITGDDWDLNIEDNEVIYRVSVTGTNMNTLSVSKTLLSASDGFKNRYRH